MKTLSTQKKYLIAIYYFFKGIAPKDIPTMDDMKLIFDTILPKLKELVQDIISLQDKSDELFKAYNRLSKEEQKEQKNEYDAKLFVVTSKSIEINEKSSEDILEIELENKDFGTMFDILKKNIKTIFKTCEDTVIFDRHLDESNGKPKVVAEIEPKEKIKETIKIRECRGY